MNRFTVYLSDDELEKLRREARYNGASVNYVLRVAVREHLGLSTPQLDRPGATVVAGNDA